MALLHILRASVVALVLIWAAVAQAQERAQDGPALSEDLAEESDQGFLAGLLEQSLGGEGRTVRITGFRGALSSTAEIDRITIADPQGVWLTMDGLTMEWSRSALLRGRIDITALRADRIDLERTPETQDDGLPEAEASGFALPDLPVAIDIKALEVARFTLGAPILGAPAALSLSAAGLFDDTTLALQFNANRIDGSDGAFVIDGRYVRGQERLALTLSLREGEGGIAARLLNLPDMPSVALRVDGTGPLSDYEMEIDLDTSGTDRVDGSVRLSGDDASTRVFDVDLTGDLAPLVAAEFRPFFGASTSLAARGNRADNGVLDLEALSLQTGTLALSGTLRLGADGWPEQATLETVLRDETGAPVILPIPGAATRVDRADLTLAYDAATDDAWRIGGVVEGFTSEHLSAARLTLDGAGRIEDRKTIDGRIEVDAEALAFVSDALQRAAGDTLSAGVDLRVAQGVPVTLSNLAIAGEDYRLTGDIDLTGLDSGFETDINLRLEADRLARFDQLAGADLRGAADVAVTGTFDLGGAADIRLDGSARDLAVGVAQVDGLLAGDTRLTIRAERDGDGTRLPQVDLRNAQLSLSAQATLQTEASDVAFDLSIPDGTRVDPTLTGALTLNGTATQRGAVWRVAARATAPFDAVANLDGAVTGPAPSLTFDLSLPDMAALVPEISGPLRMEGTARPTPDGWLLDAAASGPFASRATVNGRVTGTAAPDVTFDLNVPNIRPLVASVSGPVALQGRARQGADGLSVNSTFRGPYESSGTVAGQLTGAAPSVTYDLRLPNIAALGSPVGGPLSVSGRADQVAGAWRVTTDLTGPGGATAAIRGTVASADAVDINAQGTLPLALATPLIAPRSLQGTAQFNLTHSGAASLANLSGRITTRGARLSAPTVAVALNALDADITLGGGQAQIVADGAVSSGGQVSVRGQVALAGALNSDITATLNDVRLTDANLYDTRLNGGLSLRGPLSGGALIAGQIDVGETQVQVPNATGGGFSIIPEITHVGAPRDVRQTIARAGLNQQTSETASGAGPGFGLNLTMSAPSRVFVRGRGLDAELGGRVTLRGTTNNVISLGRFELIRGRLDVLGKRFVLDEGSVSLQGQLDPFIRFVASTSTTTGSASVIIQGPATSPQVTFEATPEAPQDEVLAQIFFGRSLGTLSPFQALQLAGAVAQLAGQGGEGIVSRLRRNFGLDDLDITTDDEGRTGLRFGKYLSENVYTDVTVGDNESAGVSLNVDLTPNLTARGTQKADGNSSIGIFFERDY
ncbi:translocation/assembly module TamB domain-containing protein [uncultured Tateyamaria sp.]|uniref:translocation/assembly module TamB domain-containing protein n=1 Tax=Tateyamaria sp. 1078 TaxID=3417464 RepID=UPI0026330AD5|nr:translocation/assembly module TamB domain-containing protein [uncultured Tateyamaria sp.]